MGIEEEIDKLVDEWDIYCKTPLVQVSSIMSKYYLEDGKEIEPVKNLINLGMEILPFLKKHIENESSIGIGGWYYVIKEITGERIIIPIEIQGRIEKLKEHLLMCLDDYL